MTEDKPSFGEYHRQGMACLTMARQWSGLPDVQDRWLMMAQTWFKLAQKLRSIVAKRPFKRCTVEIEIGLYIEARNYDRVSPTVFPALRHLSALPIAAHFSAKKRMADRPRMM